MNERDLASALADLDAQGGFQRLSYQEQARFLLAHIDRMLTPRVAECEMRRAHAWDDEKALRATCINCGVIRSRALHETQWSYTAPGGF